MFLSLFCLSAFLAPAADATQYAKPELLIDTGDLVKQAKTFRILDARSRDKYESGHIPGAAWVDHDAWSKSFDDGKDADGWIGRIGALGLNFDTPVVIYDDNRAKEAARVWWILRFWGVRDVRLLNGGWVAWKDANGEAVKDEPKIDATGPKLKAHTDRLATKDQMLVGVKDKSFQILDARSQGEFCGDTKTAKNVGAIPDARQLEWSDLLDPKTQRFKPPSELAKLFDERKIKLDRPVTTYCQSGGRASVMAFGLELMGAEKVRNYYKSWAEWGNAADTPIVKPEKPK
jgi:thiosulfate/3-mercaptopyruvate sulfurtransferase